jgi:glycosyltransferase involved in cell wall biosynthesis
MISVCIATRNGSRYVGEQLTSILSQLGTSDEIIISDDASSDNTLEIVSSFNDPRIKILKRDHSLGIVANFEASLLESKGDLIFLADQDDVWLPGKIAKLSTSLVDHDLVISDCTLVDQALKPLQTPGIKKYKTQKGLLRNLIRNSYMGCCMAFRRNVLMKALPFPNDIPMHDVWIGLVAEMYFRITMVPDQLVLHRRHQHNASTTGMTSHLTMRKQFGNRYRILKNLILHKVYAD